MTRRRRSPSGPDDSFDEYEGETGGLASVIVIDKNDDVASVCGRVDTAPTFAVVVHAPRGNRRLSTELGMRRLQRHADDSGKVVAIATSSLALANRARQVGIPVARRPEHVRWDAPGKRVLRVAGKSLLLPAVGGWVQAFAILAVFAVFIGLALTMAPSAAVKVVPPAETLSEVVTITASADFTEINLETLEVPASTITTTRTITLALRTTGTVLVGADPAKATVTITNPGEKSFSLPAGTILLAAPDLRAFALDAAAQVGPGATVDAAVTALEPGGGGNLPEGSITGWFDAANRELIVTNVAPAAGGTNVERPAFGENDRVALNQLARDLERSDVVKRFVLEGRPHDAVFLGTATATAKAGTTSMEVGEEGDIVLMDVEVTVSALAVLQATLEQVARDVLAQDGVGAFIPGSVTAVEIGDRVVNTEEDTVTTELRVSGDFARDVTEDGIREAVKGKSQEDAKSTLAERYGIQSPDVRLSPGWAPWLPRFNFRIGVELLPEVEETSTPTNVPEGNETATAEATPTPRP